MAAWNTPDYPVTSWKVAFTSGTVDIIHDPSGTPTNLLVQLATDFDDDFFGFSSDAAAVASSTSVAGKLASLISGFLPGATCAATYEWTQPGQPKTRYQLTSETEDVTLTFDSIATAARFGFEGAGPHLFPFATGTLRTDWNSEGYWTPFVGTVFDERDEGNQHVFSSVPIDPTVGSKMVAWGGDTTTRTLTSHLVTPEYLRRYQSAQAVFVGQRDTDDPNNLLELLIAACREVQTNNAARALRVYVDDADFRTAEIVNLEELQRLLASMEAQDPSQRWFDVSVTYRDTGGTGS